MATKNKKEERRQKYIRREKEKKFDEACKKLHYFPCFSVVILIVALLLFFTTWAEIYNSDIDGAEVSINGWNCFISAITGNYSSADVAYGDMAVPFYYYAASYCENLSIFTLLSVIFILIGIIVQVVTIVKKAHALNYISIILNTGSTVFILVCFATALSMQESRILPVYCSGNPACSISSLAIIPALAVLAALALNITAAVKYFIARKILK